MISSYSQTVTTIVCIHNPLDFFLRISLNLPFPRDGNGSQLGQLIKVNLLIMMAGHMALTSTV